MSFEDDLKDVGDSIGKLVDNAVNSQDFQELNQKISDTINQFVYPNRKGPFRANGTQEPSRGYSADTSYSSQHSSHNNTTQQTGPHHYSYGPGGTMPGKSANPVPKPSHTWQPPPEYGMEQPHTGTSCTARAFYAIHRSCTCRRISDGCRLGCHRTVRLLHSA